jgi:hypothetical protein
MGTDDWYLSFDCGTKGFAYSLLRIRRPSGLAAAIAGIQAAVEAGDFAEAGRRARAADAVARGWLHLAGGGGVDLVPGKKDREISTVERVRAVVAYLDGPVAAALAAAAAEGCPPADSPRLHVPVEFQPGANAPARTVAAVLLTRYEKASVFLVGPALKNKLWYPARPDLRHGHFVAKHVSLYVANKNHTKSLYFDHIAKLCGHDVGHVAPRIPANKRADFADTVLQVLAFRIYGGGPAQAAERF